MTGHLPEMGGHAGLKYAAYTLQAQYAIEIQQTERDIVASYERGTKTFLEKYIRAAYSNINEYPVDSIINWGEHIVNSSFKKVEIIAIILSAIGGGMVGSILTTFLAQ